MSLNDNPEIWADIRAALQAVIDDGVSAELDSLDCQLLLDLIDADPNATWLTEAHVLCFDHGIPSGHIADRIKSLREKLEQPDDKAQPVWLIATGETFGGQETYTRHDQRPALCDAEKLYAAPQPPVEQGAELSANQAAKLYYAWRENFKTEKRREPTSSEIWLAADRAARGGEAC